MAQGNWEADKMLDVYIYDYLQKRNLPNSAKAFLTEGKVSSDPVAIDAPGGFLYEWWSVFWDIFIARTNEKHSEVAAAYIETQQLKARELQQLSQNHQQQQQQQLQMQMIRHAQQQQIQQQLQQPPRSMNMNMNGATDPLLRQPPTVTANVMATRMYEDKLKNDESALKRYGETSGVDVKPTVAVPVVPGQTPSGSTIGRPPQQTLQDNKGDVHILNQRSPATEFNVKSNVLTPGANPASVAGGGPKNWGSLTTMDQQQRLIPQQKPYLPAQTYQPMHPLSQHQQSMLFQQGEMDPRRFRVLVRKDGQNVFNDHASGVGSPPLQAASPLSRAPSQDQGDLMYKMKLAQQQQQPSAAATGSKLLPDGTSYRSGEHIYGQIEPAPSNTSTGTAKAKGTRKRKQPASSSGPANSTGTNTAGPNSPSTPSTHTPGDALAHQRSIIYPSDGHGGTLASSTNQLAEIDRLGEDGSLDDNVESFLTQEEAADPRVDVTKATKTGFTFSEVVCLRGTTNKVVCCHFSSDGKLLATAGHEKKAILWNMDTFKLHSTLEEHSFLITDVRFSPNSTRLATSSFDKAVKVWDADNPNFSMRTFTGHQTSVMSLDFHPTNDDLFCSCDGDSEIRYWSVGQGVCTKVFKGGMTQTRFQPRHGRLLAAAAENVVSIFDVESETCRHSLQRHTKPVHSVCWDATGDFLASVSEDSVRVWALRGSDGECIHELSSNGNKFHSCVFHPSYPSVLVIGCYESLELWNMSENKSMTIPAHSGLIAALTQSPASGMVASASHDKTVKLWK